MDNIEYSYICIKPEYFDVKGIELKCNDTKKDRNIEILYKSPTLSLEGLFFKTPPIKFTQITILNKYKNYYKNYDTKYNTTTIKIILDSNDSQQANLINILKNIDQFISTNIIQNKYINGNEIIDLSTYKYDNILKCNEQMYELNMKSYLDKNIIESLKNLFNTNEKYIFTFNITNIYVSNTNLTPLTKCNKCSNVI